MKHKTPRLYLEKLSLGLRRYAGAWSACLKHLLVFPIVAPARANQFCFGVTALQDELGYDCTRIPSEKLHVVFPGIEEKTIVAGQLFPLEGSSLSALETLVIGAIIQHLRPQRVFEIGTSVGVTAYNLALNLPEGGTLDTLDLPPPTSDRDVIETKFDVTVSDRKMIYGNRQQRRFLGTPMEARITQLYGDSATFDYTQYENQFDVVFVDGSHAYEYVKADTATAVRLLKPGGWIIWHDYNDGYFWPDVRRYLKSIAEDRRIIRIEGTMFAISQA